MGIGKCISGNDYWEFIKAGDSFSVPLAPISAIDSGEVETDALFFPEKDYNIRICSAVL